ncbi:MAG: hypothetical protein Q8O00_08405 [Holophaga sp.]|nr:hypothetical protein [Holophaga sp.]
MAFLVERRQRWSRIIGVERRGAPLDNLLGKRLPDPTKLMDEDFNELWLSYQKALESYERAFRRKAKRIRIVRQASRTGPGRAHQLR